VGFALAWKRGTPFQCQKRGWGTPSKGRFLKTTGVYFEEKKGRLGFTLIPKGLKHTMFRTLTVHSVQQKGKVLPIRRGKKNKQGFCIGKSLQIGWEGGGKKKTTTVCGVGPTAKKGGRNCQEGKKGM